MVLTCLSMIIIGAAALIHFYYRVSHFEDSLNCTFLFFVVIIISFHINDDKPQADSANEMQRLLAS